MKTARWLVICGIVLFATLLAAPAHAQYVGGQPPHNGGIDQGQPSNDPPTQVLGEQTSRPANAVSPPIVKHSSSSFPLGEILGAAGAIAVLALLWFLFVWKRRKDEDEEDEGFPGFPGVPGVPGPA